MSEALPIREGQIVKSPLFNEPMKVETIREDGSGALTIGMVGTQTERFRRVTLTPEEIASLTILNEIYTYNGDGRLLRLGIQAYSLGIAYEFDPYFGLSISRVDPLPHQLEAVYDYLLKLPRVRFLLADDAGAGKTIMAGLLIRELELRGLAERILIVCPANLAFQWQRELKEKFETKFEVMKGSDIREQFGFNQWQEKKRVITSLDLAKREDILPGLQQTRWDLVIVDEAHRMSASDESHKSQRYRLGELLRDTTDHLLLLTATPHRGDPNNFTLFLQLLDTDAFADVKSIHQAMENRCAPFYLRRTKEAMVYFPEQKEDGTWAAKKIFTKRITRTVDFNIDGPEYELYKAVTNFVREQSVKAAAMGDTPRARAVGFLMALYQRRLASSTYAMRHSLENRARRLEEGLKHAQQLATQAPLDLPTEEELDEMEDIERERLEAILEAITIAGNETQIQEEIQKLKELALHAQEIENAGVEAKLSRLKDLLQTEGFFDHNDQRLLVFTEFKDTLNYLMSKFKEWGFSVGCIHGSMKPGSRDEAGTRLFTEQQFREGAIQILVATEAAGEGINLQVCNILFNYDIPWNPNRLEQRMGRIHRYGQRKDCLIFNFVATNTIEGRVLGTLLFKLQEIRNALDDDAVFNVVGEVLPSAHIERVLRDYYAGKLGDADLEDRLLRNVDEQQFRAICQNALEGLASKKLNLAMLVERRAKAQEHRVVPETISRFLFESSDYVKMPFKIVAGMPHTFDPGKTPSSLHRFEREDDWRLPALVNRYPRCSTDREIAEKHTLEWVTPGHPLFEAIRRHVSLSALDVFSQGTCFYSLNNEQATRIDFYRARVVDGLGQIIHERFFAVQLKKDEIPELCESSALGDFTPATIPDILPQVAFIPEADAFMQTNAYQPFLEEIRNERLLELKRIVSHVELSLNELIQKADEEIGKIAAEVEMKTPGSEGRLIMAENRHDELRTRRDRRREELERQRSLSLQGIERITSVLVLPHPDREDSEVRHLRQNLETEAIAMQIVIEYEKKRGCQVDDIHKKNLGYDITSLEPCSGELRLIEIKGIGASTGNILLTPNERHVAEDRPDCYWLYIVTNCDTDPVMQDPIQDPARFPWNEVKKVAHYTLAINAMTKPMEVHENPPHYGESK
ncbi:SNF2-related protein [Treponema primitia]|uniref:helicase-related protein n=1 Tax=Treponema primitia TaxID=88058 RepID=UPI003980A98A